MWVIFLLLAFVGVCWASEDGKQMKDVLKLLQEDGFSPTFVIDGGANVGKWSTDISAALPGVSILMLEGNDRHIPVLTAKRDELKAKSPASHYEFKIGILGDKQGRNVSFFAR